MSTDKEDHLKRCIPAAFMVLLLIFGCSKSEDGKGIFGGKGSSAKSDGSQVVAKVGDDVIYARQIEQFLGQLPPQVSARYGALEIRKEIAEGFVSMKMLSWEARRRGVDKREDIQLKIATLTDQILAREIEEELKKGITVSESEIKKYYDENQDRYAPHPRVHARKIVLASEADAKAVLGRLGKGADFTQVAKQSSRDASAAKGGDMGWISRGSMDPALEKTAFGLKEGQISPVIKTSDGFTILMAEKVIPGRERPYDQVKKSIERVVMREKLKKAVDELKGEIKGKAKVEINEKYFSQFKEEARPVMPGMGPGPDAAGRPAAPGMGPGGKPAK